MEKLIEGVHKFRDEEFGRYRELFARLSQEGQNPHTLFITCSDSRVLAELVTNSKPGDLFVVKNAGNIVPPATVTGSTNSTAAAIEFAVRILGVNDIVVCGHTQCGAMAALVDGLPDPGALPHLAAAAIGSRFRAQIDDPVRFGHHIQVVFDHDYRVSGIGQSMQHAISFSTSAMCRPTSVHPAHRAYDQAVRAVNR
jgi:hypothetical protein